MLHGSETRPEKKESEMSLYCVELTMISWMCGIKVRDRFTCNELRERERERERERD